MILKKIFQLNYGLIKKPETRVMTRVDQKLARKFKKCQERENTYP